MTGHRWTRVAAAAAAGYAAGLVPSADVAARLASGGRVDLREHGSGNPGGANAAAVLGARWGYGVMAADIAKGAIATRVGRLVAGDTGQHIAAVAAVVGHCYPVTKQFRGGKGVGCSVGQCLATLPAYVPIDIAIATAVAVGPSKQRAFTATAASSALWVGAATLWWRRGWPNAWGGTPTVGLPLAAAASSAVILQRFWAGHRRLTTAPVSGFPAAAVARRDHNLVIGDPATGSSTSSKLSALQSRWSRGSGTWPSPTRHRHW
ncbi:MAG: glycerol-3-phosphate acyltransferase [Acidimicrobiia bacterium]|nr:glycerol-3-phosphate acyltransferase [Acidimicrobiia bacterium]